jgi:hypothetical protein
MKVTSRHIQVYFQWCFSELLVGCVLIVCSDIAGAVAAAAADSTAATGNLDSPQPAANAGSSSSSGTGRQAGGPRRVLGAVTKPLVATATLPVRLLVSVIW